MTLGPPEQAHTWKMLFTNKSSNIQGRGMDVILENGSSLVVEVSLHFNFIPTKNQTEYEASIWDHPGGINGGREH